MTPARNRRAFVITSFASLAAGCTHHDATARADAAPTASNANATDTGTAITATPTATDAATDGPRGIFASLRAPGSWGNPNDSPDAMGAAGEQRMGSDGGNTPVGSASGDWYGPPLRMGNGRRRDTPVIVRPAAPTVSGPLAVDSVRRVVLVHLGQLAHCHEQGLAQDPQLAGRVVVRFVLDARGAVTDASVAESSVAVPAVGDCIANVVRRWQFPAAAGSTTVTYPFNLQAPE